MVQKSSVGNFIEYVLTDYEDITSDGKVKAELLVLSEEETKKYTGIKTVMNMLID